MPNTSAYLERLRACSKDEAAYRELVELFQQRSADDVSLYRLLADHFPDGITALVDHDLRFVLMNGQGLKASNLDGQSIRGRRLGEIMSETVAARDEPHIRAALQGETRSVEVSHDGKFYLVRTLPVRDAERNIIAAMVMTQDISERKHAEEQLRRNHDTFYHLIQNNPFGIYVIDADFKLRQVSLGSQKVFSNVRPLLGRDFAEVLRLIWEEPFATEAISRFWHTLTTGEPYASPSTVEPRADIEQIEAYDWRIERITLPDGRFGVVCYFYDLTERQQWEEALRRSEEQRAILFEQEKAARLQAERAMAVQQVFLGMISHELRTPLTAIKGFSSSLLATDIQFSETEQRDFLQIIDAEADRLAELIGQLMDVVQMKAGVFRVTPTRVIVAALLEAALPRLRSLVTHHRLTVTPHPDLPPVLADAQRIDQVLANLVGNASKFAPTDTEITISAEHIGDFVQINVADEGPGIPALERLQVFEAFHQVLDATRRQTGTGLGLAICKGLVEAHGGTIWIDAQDGPGTRISFTLPVAPGAAS